MGKKIIATMGVMALFILLSGCAGDVAEMFQESDAGRITRVVLDYWQKGDYETPKKFWDVNSLEDYSYLLDIDSYKIISQYRRGSPNFYSIIAQVKFKAKNGAIMQKLILFNFIGIKGEWRIYLIEEAERWSLFSYGPKGKTYMSSPRYIGQGQDRISNSIK